MHKDRFLQKIFLDDATFKTGRNTSIPLELPHATCLNTALVGNSATKEKRYEIRSVFDIGPWIMGSMTI